MIPLPIYMIGRTIHTQSFTDKTYFEYLPISLPYITFLEIFKDIKKIYFLYRKIQKSVITYNFITIISFKNCE